MFCRIARLAILFAALVFAAAPAGAVDQGTKGSKERADFCESVYSGCTKVYCDLPDASLDFLINCTAKCQQTYGRCLSAERTNGPGFDNILPGMSAGVLAEDGAGLDLHSIDLSPTSRPKLEAACKRVDGALFVRAAADNFGCINRNCDSKGGNCSVICFNGLCTGLSPALILSKSSLIRILQNGVGPRPDGSNDSLMSPSRDDGLRG